MNIRSKPVLRWILLVLVCVVSACAGVPRIAPAVGDRLTAGTWVLHSLGGERIEGLVEYPPTLRFGRDGGVSGSDGCNRVQGAYTTDGQVLNLGRIASTRMGCTNGEALSQAFVAALSITQSYRIEQDDLLFLDGTSQPIMRLVLQDD